MRIILNALLGAGSLCANFIPPAQDALLFRQDALPLDTSRQKQLSGDLIALASRPAATESTAERRATSQLLALASNLDPQAKAPRNLAEIYASEDEGIEFLTKVVLEAPLRRISETALFLLEDPSEAEHLAIAQLFLDPLATIAPELEILQNRPSASESDRWQRVVAPLDSFATRREPTPTVIEKEAMPEPPLTETEPPAEDLLEAEPFDGTLAMPIFTGGTSKTAIRIVDPQMPRLRLQAKLTNNARIKSPFLRNSGPLAATHSIVRKNLDRLHGEKNAARLQGQYTLQSGNLISRNADTLAFPVALLSEGLFQGKMPLENLVVLGSLSEDGRIRAPQYSWEFLQIFLTSESEQPRRLLIAPEMIPLLEAFLIEQKEDFFFDYDIFAVSTLEEAINLAFEGLEPPQTAAALQKFQEIREVGQGKRTAVFVANTHVLSRLQEVIDQEPRLISASLLHQKGSGDFPAHYPQEVLASLLDAALLPLTRIPYLQPQHLQPEELNQIHSQCRALLDPLARNVALSERESYDNALDLANRVRTLARAKARLNKEGNGGFHQSLFFNTHRTIQEDYYQLASRLTQLRGLESPKNPRPAAK